MKSWFILWQSEELHTWGRTARIELFASRVARAISKQHKSKCGEACQKPVPTIRSLVGSQIEPVLSSPFNVPPKTVHVLAIAVVMGLFDEFGRQVGRMLFVDDV